MIRTRGKKIIRDVLSRKVRTLLVSAAIFVGVAGTIALFSMSDILVRQLKKDVDEDKLAMAHIEVNAVSGGQLDNAAYLQKLDEADGVTQVVGGIKGQKVYFKTSPDRTEFESGWVKAYAVVNQA